MNELVTTTQRQSIIASGPAVRPLGDYVRDCIAAVGRRSDRTARAYSKAIGIFFEWSEHAYPIETQKLTGKGARTLTTWEFYPDATTNVLATIQAADLDRYTIARAEAGDSESTIKARLAAVRFLLSIAFRDGYIAADQAQRMDIRPWKARQVHSKQKSGRRLAMMEAKRLLNAPRESTYKGIRDRAILATMLFAALRREEVANLKIGDIQPDQGQYFFNVMGKGGKLRRISIHPDLWKAIGQWLEVTGRSLDHDMPLFTSVMKGDKVTGRPIDGTLIGRMVTNYANAAGIGRVSAHDLRRTAARNAYDGGAGLLRVQNMLGHADPKTTAHYIGIDGTEGKSAVDFISYERKESF